MVYPSETKRFALLIDADNAQAKETVKVLLRAILYNICIAQQLPVNKPPCHPAAIIAH